MHGSECFPRLQTGTTCDYWKCDSIQMSGSTRFLKGVLLLPIDLCILAYVSYIFFAPVDLIPHIFGSASDVEVDSGCSKQIEAIQFDLLVTALPLLHTFFYSSSLSVKYFTNFDKTRFISLHNMWHSLSFLDHTMVIPILIEMVFFPVIMLYSYRHLSLSLFYTVSSQYCHVYGLDISTVKAVQNQLQNGGNASELAFVDDAAQLEGPLFASLRTYWYLRTSSLAMWLFHYVLDLYVFFTARQSDDDEEEGEGEGYDVDGQQPRVSMDYHQSMGVFDGAKVPSSRMLSANMRRSQGSHQDSNLDGGAHEPLLPK